MGNEYAESEVVNLIVKLAGNSEEVVTTQVALFDLMGLKLTKTDICDAICAWINEGRPVGKIITKYAQGYVGKPAYIMKPTLRGERCYVKVTIRRDNTHSQLLIISAHVDH